MLGALGFGWLTDRLGRRKLFFITLTLYLAATAATALSWNLASFVLFRFLTGAGIGGEYTAINSTIQEFTPARVRGWTDLGINGTFWVGAGLGAAGSLVLLDPHLLPADWGWRACFFIGAVLALAILPMRAWVPESPRWLLTHNEAREATTIVEASKRAFAGRDIGSRMNRSVAAPAHARPHAAQRSVPRDLHAASAARAGRSVADDRAGVLLQRDLLHLRAGADGFLSCAGRSYRLVSAAVRSSAIFSGRWCSGRLFDVIGRRAMIATTYALSGILLTISGYLFEQNLLTVTTQTIAWMVIFFFASAAASSAYLTVSESFPLEIRALAIAVFYAFGTALGGIAGPAFFGRLIDTHQRSAVFTGYLVGSALMVGAAVVAAIWGVDAERKSLESVATPLSALADDE